MKKAFLLLLFAGMIYGQTSDDTDNPLQTGGLKGPIQFSDVDNINLFNGNVNFSIPLGPAYQAGPLINHQLIMVYDSALWEKAYCGWLIGPGTCPPDPGDYPGGVIPSGYVSITRRNKSRSGFGWDIHFGRLRASTTGGLAGLSARFQTPDGSWHGIYFNADMQAALTRDSTYLRLGSNDGNPPYTLQDGNGLTYEFTPSSDWPNEYVVSKIRDSDSWGNYVRITYVGTTSKISAIAYNIKGAGESERIKFNYVAWAPADSHVDPDEDLGQVLHSIQFKDPSGVFGAEYILTYQENTLWRPDNNPYTLCYTSGACDYKDNEITLPFLDRITFPDTTFYQFGYCTPDTPCNSGDGQTVGRLNAVTLPTKGRIEYSFQQVSRGIYRRPELTCVNSDKWQSTVAGLEQKTYKDQFGQVVGRIQYTFTPGLGANSTTLYTEVKSYDGAALVGRRRYAFFAGSEDCSIDCVECTNVSMGNPPLLHGTLRYEETYDGSMNLLKRVDYAYDWDAQIPNCGKRADRNLRQKEAMTTTPRPGAGPEITSVCRDTADGIDIDGRFYGHYKNTVFKDGTCLTGNTLKQTFTDWWPTTGAVWILGIYNQIRVTDGSGVIGSLSKYSFNPSTGYLRGQCVFRDATFASSACTVPDDNTAYDIFSSGNTPTNSIKTVYIDNLADSAGDSEPDGIPSYVAAYDRDQTENPTQTEKGDYRLHTRHEYLSASGTLRKDTLHQVKDGAAWEDPAVPSNGNVKWYAAREEIHLGTMLAGTTYDVTGAVSTTYAYDQMFRPVTISPQGEPSTLITYNVESGSNRLASVTVFAGGQKKGQQDLDDLGRIGKEWKSNATGEDYRVIRYDVLGRKVFESVWIPSSTLQGDMGTYYEYDFLGRPTRVWANSMGPGTGDETLYEYVGQTLKRVTGYLVGKNGQQGGLPATTEYEYDLLGRLIRVKDPHDQETFYEYDVAGNLTKVDTPDQDRYFTYDLAGRLLSESHPEGKNLTYEAYDARNNVLRYRDNKYRFHKTYDYAGRLTQVNVQALGRNAQHLYQRFYYDRAFNGTGSELSVNFIPNTDGSALSLPSSLPTGLSQGKLVSATQVNVLDGSVAQDLNPLCTTSKATWTDLYLYGSAQSGGKLAERRAYSTYLTGDRNQYFSWRYEYDTGATAKGQLSRLTYPAWVDLAAGTTTGSGRILSLDYYLGTNAAFLKSLGTAAGSGDLIQNITYTTGGYPLDITYPGGAYMHYDYDPPGTGRPYNVKGRGPDNSEWLSQEEMEYDGSGNLTTFHNFTQLIQPLPGPTPIARDPRPIGPIQPLCGVPLWTRYTMSYDALSRLTSFTYRREYGAPQSKGCAAPRDRTYDYDRYGNLTAWFYHAPNLTLSMSLPTNAADNHLAGHPYDARGNVTRTILGGTGQPIDVLLYSPSNQLWGYYVRSNGGTNVTMNNFHEYAYDWKGQRVGDLKWESAVDNTTGTCYNWNVTGSPWAQDTYYLRDEDGGILSEFDRTQVDAVTKVWGWARDNYHLFGKVAVAYGRFAINPNAEGCVFPPNPPPHKRFYMQDHLGSSRVVFNEFLADADDCNDYVDTFNYWPFGDEMWDDSYSGETYKYTGHERDYDLGLDYMMARHFSWDLHRFLSPDTVNGQLSNPQSWNKYSYVLNNPMKYIDPSGNIFVLYNSSQTAVKTFKDILNASLFGQKVTVSPTGLVGLVNTKIQGPPTAEQAALSYLLSQVIKDENATTVSLSEGSANTIIGNWRTKDIDIGDVNSIGKGAAYSSASALAHEIREQYATQVQNYIGFEAAHSEAMRTEKLMTGYTRLKDQGFLNINRNGSYTGEAVLRFQKEGRAVEVRMKIEDSNIVDVTRTQ